VNKNTHSFFASGIVQILDSLQYGTVCRSMHARQHAVCEINIFKEN